jgi:uncharacterized protein (DUF1778 family)
MSDKKKADLNTIVHAVKIRLSDEQLRTVRVAAALKGLRTSVFLQAVGLEAAKVAIESSIQEMQ